MTRPNQLDFATRCVHAGQEPDPTTGAVMMPIYTTSTYVQSSPGVHKGFDYARTKNPTRMAFERCIADLEGGRAGFAFASGLAAIATVLDCLDHGAHIIAVDDLYGGSRRLFERVRKRSAGLETTYLDPTDLGALEGAIRPNTRLIWIETPTNPLLKLAELERIAAVARPRGILAAADNTSRSARSRGRSILFWRCAASRRWRCAWSAIALPHSRSRLGSNAIPRCSASFIRDSRAIRSTRWPSARCTRSAA